MNWKTLTKIVVLVAVVGLNLYTFIMTQVSPDDTISRLIRDAALREPIIPLVMGIFLGHWFLPLQDRCKNCGFNPNTKKVEK